MPDKPDERLIILLPPDLLEEVRRAAEEADLSVSQIVRRAIRNELRNIAAQKNPDDKAATVQQFYEFIQATRNAWLHGLDSMGANPGIEPKPETSSPTDPNKIIRTLRDRK